LRVTFWDIEATNLDAGFGRLLCCSFIDLDSDEVETFRVDTKPWKGKGKIDDSKLAEAIRARLHASDIVVGWYSSQYDKRFVNARLAKHGLPPLRLTKENGTVHIDAMYASSPMKIGSRRLDNISRFFDSPNRKTALDPDTWAAAAAGDRAALDEIVVHCEADVRVLKDLWPMVAQHVKKMSFSLSEIYPFITEVPSRRNAVAA
jgi:uncharacterized protein YprB with RNaseH-like and TPR domain